MIGYKLNIEQKEMLQGKQYDDSSYFNPVQDINGDWFIFEGEVKSCTNKEYEWVKSLNKSEYTPHESESI